jgi:SAM-dependent methyltransferase
LDVGAGTTQGIHAVSRREMSEGLDFAATTLSRSAKVAYPDRPHLTIEHLVEKNLGWGKTHITSAEVLRGVENKSVGAVLSVFSLPYSKAPRLAAASIDRVLVEGGVFKGFFPTKDDEAKGISSYALFEQEFRERGYAIATRAYGKYPYVVVLAIKPGTSDAPDPEMLIEADLQDVENQRLVKSYMAASNVA